MDILLHILDATRAVFLQMAPYLLLGFLMAGVLSAVISRDYVKTHLGGSGIIASVKAALIGVPMPICSCGVIPLAASLREQGAGRGATASFLASTPQTGVDSLMITYALLGGPFAWIRALAAFISGVCCGVAVEAVSPEEKPAEPSVRTGTPGTQNRKSWKEVLQYAFLTLPRSVSKSMLLGILIAGLIGGLVPENYFADRIGDSPAALFLMLLIGIPLYVCSSGSVPIALALVKAGISPGAAMVFLMTGPATNTATLTTLWGIIGKRQTFVFLAALALFALATGWAVDASGLEISAAATGRHHEAGPGGFQYVSALLLLAILIRPLISRKN